MHATVKAAAVLLVMGCTGVATRIAADAGTAQTQPPNQTGSVDAETLDSAGLGAETTGAAGAPSMELCGECWRW